MGYAVLDFSKASLGSRIIEAARMATAVHLHRDVIEARHAGDDSRRQVDVGGADAIWVTDDSLPLATDRALPSARRLPIAEGEVE